MTGSKTVITLLNRLDHCINYDDCKWLETEIAYTCYSGNRVTPAELILEPLLATGQYFIKNKYYQ